MPPEVLDSADHLVLGYDLKEGIESGCQDEMLPRLREFFLIRKDIRLIATADHVIWPSAFDRASLRLPDWRGPVQCLWDSLSRMLEWARNDPVMEYRKKWVIAVSLLSASASESDKKEWIPRAAHVEVPNSRSNWTLLGYDVNDPYLLSGLCDCGYSGLGLTAAREEVANEINEYHLFDSTKPAIAFAEKCNSRVPAHAPFGVFGIWRIIYR